MTVLLVNDKHFLSPRSYHGLRLSATFRPKTLRLVLSFSPSTWLEKYSAKKYLVINHVQITAIKHRKYNRLYISFISIFQMSFHRWSRFWQDPGPQNYNWLAIVFAPWTCRPTKSSPSKVFDSIGVVVNYFILMSRVTFQISIALVHYEHRSYRRCRNGGCSSLLEIWSQVSTTFNGQRSWLGQVYKSIVVRRHLWIC